MYLLPGLQRACGQVLANRLSIHNVLTQLRLARFFNLQQLENQCASFIAAHIEKVGLFLVVLVRKRIYFFYTCFPNFFSFFYR